MTKNYKKLLGLTLIELMITISLVVILAGVSIANMNKMRRPKDLVDEATDTIVNTLNQANAVSASKSDQQTSEPQFVCEITAGAGANGRAGCTSPIQPTWKNVNGAAFNTKVVVTIKMKDTTPPTLNITYQNGLVSGIPPTSAFIITVKSKVDSPPCSNTITLWPNSVIEVDKNCGT